MSEPLPFRVGGNSEVAFAAAYAEFSRATPETVAAVVQCAAEWHRTAPAAACTGILERRPRPERRAIRREERRAQRACEQHVRETVPQSLGIIGWIQIGLWLWQNRRLIADVVRLFREFLANRPHAFRSVMEA